MPKHKFELENNRLFGEIRLRREIYSPGTLASSQYKTILSRIPEKLNIATRGIQSTLILHFWWSCNLETIKNRAE